MHASMQKGPQWTAMDASKSTDVQRGHVAYVCRQDMRRGWHATVCAHGGGGMVEGRMCSKTHFNPNGVSLSM